MELFQFETSLFGTPCISFKILQKNLANNQVIPDHGNPRKGGQCLAVIYSTIVALNTRLFSPGM